MSELKQYRRPFPEWEMRPRYAPDNGITNVWVNIYIGPVTVTPEATRETVIELRALADDIEALLNEKALDEDTNNPQEDAAMDTLSTQEVRDGE